MTTPSSGRRFPLIRVVVGVFVLAGAGLGWMDAGWVGLPLGAIIGGGVGLLVGLALRLIVWAVRRDPTEQLPPDGRRPRLSFTRSAAGLVGLACLALLGYEARWLINLTAANLCHQTGAILTQATARGDKRSSLRDQLNWRRWQSVVLTARPLRWALTSETLALHEAVAALTDTLDGKSVELPPDHQFHDKLLTAAVQVAMQSDDGALSNATDPLLNSAGAAMTDASAKQMNASLAAMTFRWSPAEWFAVAPVTPDAVVRYHLIIESAVIADVKEDGQPWDPLGNAPDPFVTVITSSDRNLQPQSTQTAVKKDTHQPAWQAVIATVAVGDRITLKVWDDDVVKNDLAGEYKFTVTRELVEAGGQTVSFEPVKELRFILRRVE